MSPSPYTLRVLPGSIDVLRGQYANLNDTPWPYGCQGYGGVCPVCLALRPLSIHRRRLSLLFTAQVAFRIGRRIGKHPFAGRLFCLTERWLPLQRIAREDGVLAFYHPRPIAKPHVLIVPTQPLPSLTTDRMSEQEKWRTIWRMVQVARDVAGNLSQQGVWQMVINGGSRQEIGQLHAHLLIAECAWDSGTMQLSDPASDPTSWAEMFDVLKQAEHEPDSGYSLEIRWNVRGEPVARITQ